MGVNIRNFRRSRIPARPLALLLLLIAGLSPTLHAEEEWFMILLSGQHAGWEMRDDRVVDGRRVVIHEQKITMARGSVEIVTRMRSETTEPLEGEDRVIRVSQRMGALPRDLTYRFTDEGIGFVSVEGDSRIERTLPAPKGDWISGAEALDRIKKEVKAQTPKFSFTTIEPMLGIQPIEITYELEASDIEIPDVKDARKFSQGVHRYHPEQKLAYNLSPSFNWDASGMTDAQLASFNDDLGKVGYVWQFITLAGFHSNGLIITKLARSFGDRGMLAYVQDIQRQEREHQVELLTHQKWSGAELVDQMVNVASGGVSSTAAMGAGVTESQFGAH